MAISAYGVMLFPEKLEKEIGRSGKSQSALSRETGVGQSAISAMTRGERRPFMDQAFKLARALGLPLDYLADEEQDEPPSPEITADERAIITLIRVKGLSLRAAMERLDLDDEALRRLAAETARKAGAVVYNPGSVRDQTSLIQAGGTELVRDRRREEEEQEQARRTRKKRG